MPPCLPCFVSVLKCLNLDFIRVGALPTCMLVHHICTVPREVWTECVLELLKLELLMIVSHDQ